MSNYKYTRDELTLDISEAGSSPSYAAVGLEYRDSHNPRQLVILVNPEHRQAAAQALAGDDFEVVEKLADWERELLDRQSRMDPADVKVGDVVEVEANDGSWLMRGEVLGVNSGASYPFRITAPQLGGSGIWPRLRDAIVRLVRRAEPEPDREQIKALTERIGKANLAAGPAPTGGDYADWWELMARELVRRGVTVGGAS